MKQLLEQTAKMHEDMIADGGALDRRFRSSATNIIRRVDSNMRDRLRTEMGPLLYAVGQQSLHIQHLSNTIEHRRFRGQQRANTLQIPGGQQSAPQMRPPQQPPVRLTGVHPGNQPAINVDGT